MILRHQRHKPLVEFGEVLKIRQRCRAEDKNEIDLIGGKFPLSLFVIANANVEIDLRVIPAERTDSPGQELQGDGLTARNPHLAASQPAQVFQPRSQPFCLGELLTGMTDKYLSGCRQTHATRCALKQLRIELRLQVLNSARQCRWVEVQLFRRASYRTCPGDTINQLKNPHVAHIALSSDQNSRSLLLRISQHPSQKITLVVIALHL